MSQELVRILGAFPERRVLVIGEAMLDSYLDGPSGRLCREAPVPVVNLLRRDDVPGGAANTAVNAACLGAKVAFLSVIGDDAEGILLLRALEARGLPTADVLVQPGRRTLAKHRVLAGGQMVVRFDQGDTGPIAAEQEQELIRRLRSLYISADAVIVSDYSYGVLTPAVIDTLRELQAAHPPVLLVDARNLPAYRRVPPTAVKPNYEEASQLLGLAETAAFSRAEALEPEGPRMLAMTGARIAAVTLDRDGALIFEQGRAPYRTHATATRNARVAGAGDTYSAAFALALASGAATAHAADLASAAASVVVAKDGTATCSDAEVREHLTSDGKYVRDRTALVARVEMYRQQGRRVVFTNGCFDILHSGHITYLNRARGIDDVLVVGLNSDDSVRRLKGPERPINTLEDRARVLAALSCVDHVVPFDEDTPVALIQLVRPDLYVKGGDYTEDTLPEAPLVRSLGGQVQILPFVEYRSTSSIIARIREEPPHRSRGPRAPERSPASGRRRVG
ncbi:MAG: D-glycero-beta-D-manno-heptose 1-phosphate adenylyltransferase [Hyphomicrobiales bacterium]